jgi:hypothetical protein
MPPKGVPARAGLGRPAQQNNSYVRHAINELSSPENRSVVVAVSFFLLLVFSFIRISCHLSVPLFL